MWYQKTNNSRRNHGLLDLIMRKDQEITKNTRRTAGKKIEMNEFKVKNNVSMDKHTLTQPIKMFHVLN